MTGLEPQLVNLASRTKVTWSKVQDDPGMTGDEPGLPPQNGTVAGYYLKTNGTDASWQPVVTAAARTGTPPVIVSMTGGGTWTTTNGTITATGTDEVGKIVLVTGTGVTGTTWQVANGPIFTVTLANGAFTNGFEVLCMSRNSNTAIQQDQFSWNAGWYARPITSTTWALYATTSTWPLADGLTYEWTYMVKGY